MGNNGTLFSTIIALVAGMVIIGLLIGAIILVALVVAGLWIAVSLAYYAALGLERAKARRSWPSSTDPLT